MGAIEVQASTSQRTYLARLLTNLFTLGENLASAAGSNDSIGISCIFAICNIFLSLSSTQTIRAFLSSCE